MGCAAHIPASQTLHPSDEPSVTDEEEEEDLPALVDELQQELDRDEARHHREIHRFDRGRSNNLKELAGFGLKWHVISILLFVCCSALAIITTPIACVLLHISWVTKMTRTFYEVGSDATEGLKSLYEVDITY